MYGVFIRLGFLALFAGLVLSGCSSFRSSDDRIGRDLTDAPSEPVIRTTTVDGWTIRSLEAGDPNAPQVVLIHGAPGSLDDYIEYFRDERLVGQVHLVSVDRPGYGYSEYGRIETSVERQNELLRPLVRPGAIIVGHSYGGTNAIRLAMDEPDLVGGVVVVAGSMSPEDERVFFFNRPMERPLFNWMMSPAWRVANAEKVTRVTELERMAPLWARVTAPVVLIHGTDDSLVPYAHSEYAAAMLVNAEVTFVTLPGESHFILWSERDLVVDEIVRLLPSP